MVRLNDLAGIIEQCISELNQNLTKVGRSIYTPEVKIVDHSQFSHKELFESLWNIDLVFFVSMGRTKSILIPEGRISAITTSPLTLIFQEGMTLMVTINEAVITEQGRVNLHTVKATKRFFSLGTGNAFRT